MHAATLQDTISRVVTESVNGPPALIESEGAVIANHLWRVSATTFEWLLLATLPQSGEVALLSRKSSVHTLCLHPGTTSAKRVPRAKDQERLK